MESKRCENYFKEFEKNSRICVCVGATPPNHGVQILKTREREMTDSILRLQSDQLTLFKLRSSNYQKERRKKTTVFKVSAQVKVLQGHQGQVTNTDFSSLHKIHTNESTPFSTLPSPDTPLKSHSILSRQIEREWVAAASSSASMGFSSYARVLTLLYIYAMTMISSGRAQTFKCITNGATCNGLVGYVSPNRTTLADIKTLFGIKNLRSLLGANNLPLSTLPTNTVHVNDTLDIPFPCLCNNGTGMPRHRLPIYTVVPDDGLYHIAAEVFKGLVTYQQIQVVNNIPDANLIKVGQELWIPLPCSCDELDGDRVVHYGHVVEPGSSLEKIAQRYDTTEDTLRTLNSLEPNSELMAGVVLDVPLKACTSMVSNNSLDYPLLVANGTYAFTAGNCVKCTCDSANNWTLQCEPSQVNSSLWEMCPSMKCEGAENLYIGNTSSSGCNRTTCTYAGYNNQTIFKTLALESTCSGPNNAAKLSLRGWRWSYLIISIHLVVLYLHFIK